MKKHDLYILNIEFFKSTLKHMPEADERQIGRDQSCSARHKRDQKAIQQDAECHSMLVEPIRNADASQNKIPCENIYLCRWEILTDSLLMRCQLNHALHVSAVLQLKQS